MVAEDSVDVSDVKIEDLKIEDSEEKSSEELICPFNLNCKFI